MIADRPSSQQPAASRRAAIAASPQPRSAIRSPWTAPEACHSAGSSSTMLGLDTPTMAVAQVATDRGRIIVEAVTILIEAAAHPDSMH